MRSQRFTKKQADIIAFNIEHKKIFGYLPSLKSIGEKFGISIPTAHQHMEAIKKKDVDLSLVAERGDWSFCQVCPHYLQKIKVSLSKPKSDRGG